MKSKEEAKQDGKVSEMVLLEVVKDRILETKDNSHKNLLQMKGSIGENKNKKFNLIQNRLQKKKLSSKIISIIKHKKKLSKKKISSGVQLVIKKRFHGLRIRPKLLILPVSFLQLMKFNLKENKNRTRRSTLLQLKMK